MIRETGGVLIEKAFDPCSLHKFRCLETGVEEAILEIAMQIPSKPGIDRNPEASFSPAEKLRREMGGDGPSQDRLPAPVGSEVHGEGDAGGEFDEAMIEKRNPRLQGMDHRGAVYFCEDIAGKIEAPIQVEAYFEWLAPRS